MSRTSKLHERIDELKSEFIVLITVELERVVSGRSSVFLDRKRSCIFDGRSWATPESDHLEKVERELATLAQSLGDAEATALLGIVENHVTRVKGASDALDGGAVHIARETLRRVSEMNVQPN